MQKQSLFNRFLSKSLTVFFDFLYHQFAWAYDWVAATVSVGMWNDWVQCIAPDLTGNIVLELGHGPGHLYGAIPGSIVIGLDRSKQMGRIAKKRLASNNCPAHLVNGDAINLPFASNYFDQLAATFPTEYITHPHTLSEINRVLKPNGELYIVPSAWIIGKKWTHKIMAWLFKFTGQAPERDTGLFEKERLILENAGFSVYIEIRTISVSKVMVILCKNSAD